VTRKAVISGIADTKCGRLPEHNCMSLHTVVAQQAIADAGLNAADIDGVLAAFSFTQPHMMLASVFCEYMGLKPGFMTAVQSGGATAATAVMIAAALVESKMCKNVLVVTGDNRLTGLPPGGAAAMLAQFGHPQFEQPFGISIPAAYALVAQRYLHEYRATERDLAAISVTQRAYAAQHPHAHMRDLITVDDVMGSRTIASPLKLLDCCLVSDGAAAVVVSDPDAISASSTGITLMGSGQGHTHEHIFAAPSLLEFGCKQAAERAFERAGVTPDDIDIAEIYDSFTITLAVELESMGFFKRGEAAAAAASGALGPGGELPCNTHGGLLSYGHSGAAGGMFHVVEAVRQLRGQTLGYRVASPELAFVHGDGGVLSAHCSLILGRTH
jgi:acetyl-CoA acetyltransferase